MKRIIKFAVLTMIVTVVITIASAVVVMRTLYRGFSGDAFVTIPHGAGTIEIGRTLAREGVIHYAWQFWLERALHGSQRVQAGEYKFDTAASAAAIFDRLRRGDTYYFEFTVPEGSNMFDIARSLESAGVMTEADFLHAAENPESISDLAPHAPSLEGYLFPSTYRLAHSTTPEQLCREMTAQFRKIWRKIAEGKAADVNHTVTLASLVEKETGVAEERPLIAGVFFNRLELGMKLDCDPTTIYAAELDHRYRGVIHKSDLASDNPYNTYHHDGLPPGPIANPGVASLEAALAPAQTNYLYFVAKAEGGGHVFSTTLQKHEQAAHAYRNKRPRKTD